MPIPQPPESEATNELLHPEKLSNQQQSDYCDVMRQSQVSLLAANEFIIQFKLRTLIIQCGQGEGN